MTRASFSFVSLAAALASLATAVAFAPVARAQRPGAAAPTAIELTPPAGWKRDDARSAAQLKSLRGSPHLGSAEVDAAAAFYRAEGAALIISEVTADPAPADAAASARAELASLHGVVEVVKGTLVSWRFLGGEPALPEARLEWKDEGVGTTSITRALVIRTAEALTVVTGECVLGADAAAMRGPCETALASMRPKSALVRLEVGMGAADPAETQPDYDAAAAGLMTELAAGGAGKDRAVGGLAEGASLGRGAPQRAPTMAEGKADLPTTILVRPPAKTTDRRPLYLLAGIAVLALVFLWNRRQRTRLDEIEERERQRAERRGEREAARTTRADEAPPDEGSAAADDSPGGRPGKPGKPEEDV